MNFTYPKFLFTLTFLFLCTVHTSLFSQSKMSSFDAEIQTYDLYDSGKWDQLIEVAKEAIENKYDYFYMRMRLGIAYYETQKYKLAEIQFKKALGFNSKNDVVKEYLYYCYKYTGRDEEARKLIASFSLDLKKKLEVDKLSNIDFIVLEGAQKRVNSEYSEENNSVYFGDATYTQIGLKHYVKNNFSLFHAVSYFGQSNSTGDVTQFQYFAQATIPLKNNWLISPAFHVVSTNFKGETSLGIDDVKNRGIIGSMSFTKNHKNWNLGLGSTYSNISDQKQYNHFFSLAYSILGNSKLILGSTQYLHTIDNYSTIGTSVSPFVYFKPTLNSYVNVSYLHNTENNIVEQNGYLVNNSLDLTNSRFSVLVNYDFTNKFSVYTMYQSENKTNSFSNFEYNYKLFLLGLKLGFGKR